MRKMVLVAAGCVALIGVTGLAVAQEGPAPSGPGMFQRADANSDGTVSRQEFDALHDAHFAQADANHDGQVTGEERRAMHAAHRAHDGHDGRRHRRHMRHLEASDANNDGSITREEFLARPNQMFDRLDANRDNIISQEERPHPGRRGEGGARHNPDTNNDGQVSRAEHAAAGAAMFERMDADHDGRVTQAEAAAAHRPRP